MWYFFYVGGDFHVYYTKDDNGEYKIPRIAIRMDEENIGEIRGVADNQNVEDGFEDIVEKKIRTFSNLDEENINEYLKIINNMKKLTLLNRKNKNKEKFTLDDIYFIYELKGEIEGFGWKQDPRIDKIIRTRDSKKDYESLKSTKDKVKFFLSCNRRNIKINKIDKEIAIEAVKQDENALKYIDKKTEKYREIVLEALKKNGYLLEFVDDNLKKDKEVVLVAVSNFGISLRFADESLKKDKEVVLVAVNQAGCALEYANNSLKKDREVVLAAVRQNGYALEYVDKTTEGYREIAIEAVKQDAMALECIDKNDELYKEILIEIVKTNIEILFDINLEDLLNDIDFVTKLASAAKENEDSYKYNIFLDDIIEEYRMKNEESEPFTNKNRR